MPFFRLDRSAGSLPGVPTATQGVSLGEAGVTQFQRHTDAAGVLMSGTVDDRQSILRPGWIDVETVSVDADVTAHLQTALPPGLRRARVQHGHWLACIHAGCDLFGADSDRLGSTWYGNGHDHSLHLAYSHSEQRIEVCTFRRRSPS